MLTSKDIKDVTFGKMIRGYNVEEVDMLLDKVQADYVQYERTIEELQRKIQLLNQEFQDSKTL